jgi:preprotein translocase subunit YajC
MGDTGRALLPLLLLVLAFVVLVILPMRSRNRAVQKTRDMQARLTPGVEVMTTSGLFGRIASVGDDTVQLEVAPGVVVRWARAGIAEVKSPGAGVGDEPTASPNEDTGAP